MALEVIGSSSPTPPEVLETPSPLVPPPTALPVTPHPNEKHTTTLLLHEETSAKDAEKVKRQSFLTRALWTCIMIGGFIGAQFSFLLSYAN